MNTYDKMIADKQFPVTFFNYCPMGSPGGRPESVQDWVDAGINVGRSPGFREGDNPAEMLAILDACAEANIQMILVDERCSVGRHCKAGDDGLRKSMEAALKDFGDHPGLFGFDIGDEPANSTIPHAFRTTAIHREMAPHLTGFSNLGPYAPGTAEWMGRRSFRGFLDDYCEQGNPQFLCFDIYSQMEKSEYGLNNYFRCLRMYADAAKRAGIPWWVTLLSVGHYKYLCPDEDAFRWQISTAVAHGAQGLAWFFLYMRNPHGNYRVPPIDEHWERTETYEWLSRTQRCFNSMQAAVLTQLTHHQVWHVGESYGGFTSDIDSEYIKGVKCDYPVIISEFFDRDGRPYVLVVNNTFTESGQVIITWHGDPKAHHITWESTEHEHRKYFDDDWPENPATSTGPWLAPGQMELFRVDYEGDNKPVGYPEHIAE